VDIRDLTEEQRRDLHAAVLLYAVRITKSRDLAEELTQEAFSRSMTTRRWDPSTQPSLAMHMCGIVKSLLSAERRAKRHANEEKAAREEVLISGGAKPSAEAISLDDARRKREGTLAARRVEALRARLVGHELELVICDLMTEGTTKPAALARRAERSIDEIRAALRRIRRYADRIPATERGEDPDEEVT
jgi:DNA-directed RNA polymerase specialized sigma24 family protein